jgi:hypothetical protein
MEESWAEAGRSTVGLCGSAYDEMKIEREIKRTILKVHLRQLVISV